MTKRILYVEDMPQNMLLVRRIMEALGHELLEAADGETGWEAIVSHRPDLILMDLLLPGDISGFELIRRIKSHPQLNRIPVVALTAYGYDEVEQTALTAGCDGFLCKPADIRQIRAAINRFLNVSAIGKPMLLEPDEFERSLSTAAYTFI